MSIDKARKELQTTIREGRSGLATDIEALAREIARDEFAKLSPAPCGSGEQKASGNGRKNDAGRGFPFGWVGGRRKVGAERGQTCPQVRSGWKSGFESRRY